MTIVDTPGFDDSHLSDRDILMKLLQWLKAAYTDGRKLSGIVYLHRIDLPRMQGSALRNFGMFKQLCGEEFSTNIVLGTTCWDLVTSEDGARRESQLKEKGGFWYSLIQKGSSVLRIPQSQDSCRDILLDIAHKSPVFLKSQDEMGRMGLNLDQVSAIKALDPELEEAKRQHAAAKARQEAEFRRRQQELERQKKAEIEAQKRRRAEEVRRQQRERERIREEIRQQELQRRKEMEEMEARMRRMRIEEQRQRRERQKEQEKKLTDIQFQNDYQLLYQARKYGTQSARLIVPWGIEICDNCFTLIENAPCVSKFSFLESQFKILQILTTYGLACPVPSCGQFQFFDLCMTCKPKGGVYCPGGSSHWPLKEDTRPCRYSEGPAIGEKTCWNCSTPIGPLAIRKISCHYAILKC